MDWVDKIIWKIEYSELNIIFTNRFNDSVACWTSPPWEIFKEEEDLINHYFNKTKELLSYDL